MSMLRKTIGYVCQGHMWYNFTLYGDGSVCSMLFYTPSKLWYFIDVKGHGFIFSIHLGSLPLIVLIYSL